MLKINEFRMNVVLETLKELIDLADYNNNERLIELSNEFYDEAKRFYDCMRVDEIENVSIEEINKTSDIGSKVASTILAYSRGALAQVGLGKAGYMMNECAYDLYAISREFRSSK